MTVTEIQSEVLKQIYLRCCNILKLSPGEFMQTMITATKNKINTAVIESKYVTTENDPIAIALRDEGFLKEYNNTDSEYVLTSRGVWYIETTRYGITVDNIISALDDKFFVTDLKKINDKNKLILFSLIAVHAFSEKCGVNYVDLGCESAFLGMARNSSVLLKKLGRIKAESFESMFTSNHNQKTKTATLTGTINELPGCTYSLFIGKKNCYYLNLYKDGEINKNDVKKLLKVVFDTVSISEIDDIVSVCLDISAEYSTVFCKDDRISSYVCHDIIETSVNELAGL